MGAPIPLVALRSGRMEPAPAPIALRAGPVTLLLDGADLRHVRAGSAELVQRVYIAVRDEPWNTIPGRMEERSISTSGDSFRVTFTMRHRHQAIDFSWRGTIEGASDGTVRYEMDGTCHGTFRYSKIGFNLHHALPAAVGRPFRARTAAGELRGVLPRAIDPQRVRDGTLTGMFDPYDELAIEVVDGVEAIVALEGDLLELQDHRNWIDGNLKSYATPLALGFPFTSEDGRRIHQVLTIRHRGSPPPAASGDPVVRIGGRTGDLLPRIGLGRPSHREALTPRQVALLREVAPAHLRAELTLLPGGWEDDLVRAVRDVRMLGVPLELALFANEGSGDELAALAHRLRDAAADVARVLIYPLSEGFSVFVATTPASIVRLVREALEPVTGTVVFAGGTNQSFVDINRAHPTDPVLTGLCVAACPTVHAADDASIVENIAGLLEMARYAREVAAGRSLHISPITLATPAGPYPGGPPGPDDLPGPVDPRQASLLGAAWTAGAVGALAEAGVSTATFYETTGWRGLMEVDAGSPMPDRFPSRPGDLFPVFHLLADLAAWRDAPVLRLEPSDPLRVTGVAVERDGAPALLLANVTPDPLRLRVADLPGEAASVRLLDEASAAWALSEPALFRGTPGTRIPVVAGSLWITLAPYAVATILPG